MIKLIRTSTVALSLDVLLKGQLAFLSKYYDVVAVSGADHHLDAVKQREGVRTESVEMARQINLWRDLVSLLKLYRLFRREKPAIVHSITPKAGLLSMIAARLAGVPVRIHTFTGLIFPTSTGLKKKLLIAMDCLLCRMATHVYPEGEGVRRDLLRYRITNKPLKVLAHGNISGVDTGYFALQQVPDEQKRALRSNLGLREDDVVFIFVGRLVADKGLREIVDAFTRLAEKQLQTRLILVGPTETADPIDHTTADLMKNHDRIITTGYQSDIRPYLAIADVFLLASYREGFPNVVLQAGAMELPCVVTDINGANEIIEHAKNGLIVPVRHADALLHAMQCLASDKVLREEMGKEGRRRIEQKFSNSIVWRALQEEYETLTATLHHV